MSAYRMLAYFGRMTSTAFPRSSSSRLRPDTMSPSPPAFAAGAHSAATITTYTAHPPVPPAGFRRSPCVLMLARGRRAASPASGEQTVHRWLWHMPYTVYRPSCTGARSDALTWGLNGSPAGTAHGEAGEPDPDRLPDPPRRHHQQAPAPG